MGRGLGLAELGNKAELDQLGLELWLNWSLEDFPGWGWVGGGGWGWLGYMKIKPTQPAMAGIGSLAELQLRIYCHRWGGVARWMKCNIRLSSVS